MPVDRECSLRKSPGGRRSRPPRSDRKATSTPKWSISNPSHGQQTLRGVAPGPDHRPVTKFVRMMLPIGKWCTSHGDHGQVSGNGTEPTAAIPQIPIASALFCGGYISPMLAPPVASAGEPRTPVTNRKTRSIEKLVASAVGTWKSTKSARVEM